MQLPKAACQAGEVGLLWAVLQIPLKSLFSSKQKIEPAERAPGWKEL